MQGLDRRTVIVTGAASGIGAATAAGCSPRAPRWWASTSRHPTQLGADDRLLAMAADVTDATAVAGVVDADGGALRPGRRARPRGGRRRRRAGAPARRRRVGTG